MSLFRSFVRVFPGFLPLAACSVLTSLCSGVVRRLASHNMASCRRWPVRFRAALFIAWLVAGPTVGRVVAEDPAALATLPSQLRVLSYNIHHGRGTDGQVDIERIAQVIARSEADLVALQEVDNGTLRTGRVDQTAELARLTGLHGRFVKQLDFEGGEYGQAILSRWPLTRLDVHWLPGVPERERRIVGVVVLCFAGRSVTFATTHLHHNNQDIRLQQAKTLTKVLSAHPGIVILAGDLNAEPASPPIDHLGRDWHVVASERGLHSFPAPAPTSQIDYVLFRPADSLRVVWTEVLDEPQASDHRPLLTVLEQPRPRK